MLVVLVLVMLVYVEVEMVKLLVVVEVNVLVVSVVLVSVPRMLVVIVSSSTSVLLSKASSSGLPGMWSNYVFSPEELSSLVWDEYPQSCLVVKCWSCLCILHRTFACFVFSRHLVLLDMSNGKGLVQIQKRDVNRKKQTLLHTIFLVGLISLQSHAGLR